MRSVGRPIKLAYIESKQEILVDAWFQGVTERLRFAEGPTDPLASTVTKGQWIIWKNTTTNEIRLWVNDNGTMKKSVALT